MKKLLISLVVIFICSTFFNEVEAKTPTTAIKKYKNNENFTYVVIKGEKYKKVNSKMLKFTKYEYNRQKYLKNQLEKDKKERNVMPGMTYYSNISCKPKFKSSKKVSVLCKTFTYAGGGHGELEYNTFNTINGKEVNLKGAFKSATNYSEGINYAKKYVLKHTSKYYVDNVDGIFKNMKKHPFYWTKNGLNLTFNPYVLDSGAAGMKTVPVTKKYLK